MKKTFLAAALLTLGSASTAFADGHAHHLDHGAMRYGAKVVTVSCYRGPWQEVIWDRPHPVFVDSLVAAGYNFSEAHAIAERICKDRSLVGNVNGLVSATYAAIAAQPPGSRRR